MFFKGECDLPFFRFAGTLLSNTLGPLPGFLCDMNSLSISGNITDPYSPLSSDGIDISCCFYSSLIV